MADELNRRAWEALVKELGPEEATRFWREAGLDGAPPDAPLDGLAPDPLPERAGAHVDGMSTSSLASKRGAVAWVPWENPVLTLAFRRHMRHLGPFGLQLAYVALLGAVFLVVQAVVVSQSAGRPMPRLGPLIGRSFWLTSSLIQVAGLGLVAAVLGACAFAVEREQRTSEALWLTLLRPRDLLLGKTVALAASLTLLIFSALPLLCISFLFGGVSPADVARSTALILASALGFLAVGLACSACSRRAIRAIVAAALITGAFLFGLPLLAALQQIILHNGSGQWVLGPLVVLNPLFAVGHLYEPIRPLSPSLSDACILFYACLALASGLTAWRRLAIEARGAS
jgi:ABC-2 type transport system permease protein